MNDVFVINHKLNYDWQGVPLDEYWPEDENEYSFYYRSKGYGGYSAADLFRALQLGFKIADSGYTGIEMHEVDT